MIINKRLHSFRSKTQQVCFYQTTDHHILAIYVIMSIQQSLIKFIKKRDNNQNRNQALEIEGCIITRFSKVEFVTPLTRMHFSLFVTIYLVVCSIEDEYSKCNF